MLEGLVANLLNRFLGMYVQNFDAKQLNVGIWSGDVKLRDLHLRREALDQLHLPLNVVEGHLGQLTLQIPWSNLRGKPVKVNIEDVFLLAAPREDADYDADEEERRAHAVKMEKLDSAELLKERNTEGMSKEEQQRSQSFTTSLVTAIVDNVQVTVKNIHVRYEDSISDPGHPFALGLTLAEFSAVSTDGRWQPTFIQGTSSSTHKLASLGSLAVYWDTDAELLGSGKGSQVSASERGLTHEEFVTKLRDMIVKGDSPSLNEHQFILKPVTGRAGLEMDKTGRADRPKIKAQLLFDELGFIIDEDQYRDALMLVDLFHYFIRHQEYKKYQPASPLKEDPRAWLQFAGKAVLDKIHERNRRWSWAYFAERRDDRIRYIELFKKRKKDERLSPPEAEDLDRLERKLTYEDLRFWRSLARNQLRKENVGVTKPPPKQTWSQWIWGGKQEEEEKADDSQMTEQQRKELYDAIDWDEKKSIAEAVDLPREYVKMEVKMNLRTGSFTLKRDPHGRAVEILRLLFDSFSTEAFQRADSMLAKLSLGGMRLYDGTTDGSLFPQIIKIKDAPSVPGGKRIEELDDKEGPAAEQRGNGGGGSDGADGAERAPQDRDQSEDDEGEIEPFFQLEFENNPLDGRADTALVMKLKAMEFVYNPRFIEEVVKFFKPPERHMESIGALMESAGEAVEGIRKQTRAGLEFALEEHKTVDAQLDLQAPLIIVPDSVTEECTICLIVDMGHASVTSELVDKDTLREIHSKQSHQITTEDYKRLEGLMYDKFLLRLDSTQVLIGPSIDETRAQLEGTVESRDMHIIDRISMDFAVETCIIPKASDLTKFRISGHLPVLHALVSDAKYKSLMKLVDVAIPKFDRDQRGQEVEHGVAPAPNLKPAEAGDQEQDILGRPRSKSFQFAAQERELVLEEDSDTGSQAGEHPEPSGTVKKTDLNLNQRNFEFKFTVDRLQGSLYRSDPDGEKPDELLVDLIAEHFYLEFYQQPYNMVAEVRLQSLAVEDHVEENPVPEFKYIVSSEDIYASSQKDLFQLKFVKVNQDSPEFVTKYEGIPTNLDVAVSTITLIVTRRTLLTLLDFVLITFTNPNTPQDANQTPDARTGVGKEQAAMRTSADVDKIRIKAELTRIAVILNNDGIRLATLSLNSADVGVFLMGGTMRVGARLGNLSLVDDVNQGVPAESSVRQLVSIQGEELADFKYETFDEKADSYPGYDTSIYLRSGSLQVNFVTEPFRKIMDFAVKFGKMQAIFNAARQAAAQQAGQMQDKVNKMHFDIVVNTPIIVFPRMVVADTPERDLLTAYLGEIYLNNRFVPLDDSEKADTANKLSTGIRNIRLTSSLHYSEGQSEELELIDKVDLGFNVTIVEHKPQYKRPDYEIQSSMSNINLRLTPDQMKFMLELSRSIPAAFATEPEEAIEEDLERELPESTVEPARAATEPHEGKDREVITSQSPELGSRPDTWTKLDLIFKAGAIGLELIQGKDDEPVGDLAASSLSKFSLNETNIKLRMLSDGSLESELLVRSFTIMDTREEEATKFRKIMSLINNDVEQQFKATISLSAGPERSLMAVLEIDSPRVILALDYLFAIQAFVNAGLATEEPVDVGDEADEGATTENESTPSVSSRAISRTRTESQVQPHRQSEQDQEGMSIAFRLNLADAQVVLIANPAIGNTEAIVLSTEQVLLSRQRAVTLQIDKVGMFLCRMDRIERQNERLRILDDFSMQASLDMRSSANSSFTSIQIDIEPLVLRLSLRDILLVMQIINKASEMNNGSEPKMAETEPKKLKQSKATPGSRQKSSIGKGGASTTGKKTTKTVSTRLSGPPPVEQPPGRQSAVMKREEMILQMNGIRVILIGDLHELPMLDWSVEEFAIDVRDWSGAMVADTNIHTSVNIYNFSKSAWEALLEPLQLGFHLSKDQVPERLNVELYSRKRIELTVTTATIALASKSADFLSSDEDVLSKPRRVDAPYTIRNYTGFDLEIWAVPYDENGRKDKLADGEEKPWRFADPTTTRKSLSPEGATGVVGISITGSGFDNIDRIPVRREGEFLYNLRPRRDRTQHRLLVEVKLGADNVKYITFRSPLLVENNASIPVDVGVFSPDEGHLTKIEKIPPGDSRPAPVGSAFMHSLVIRPDEGFGYNWSDERLFWKDLERRPTRTLTCRSLEPSNHEPNPPFYFQMHAVFETGKGNPLRGIYPYMRIRLSPPIEIRNLLPFDFTYRIYDRDTKKDYRNFLRKGGESPVHVVPLSHMVLSSIEMKDTQFQQSGWAIIHDPRHNYESEKTFEVKDRSGLSLRLKLHYHTMPESGGAFKVTVYSPYVILNRTRLKLDVHNRRGVFANEYQEDQTTSPLMFSYNTDDRRNRALLKVGDSEWSKPQSFDAIGSTYDVTLPSPDGWSEMHVGVTVTEGEGKYNLIKVISVTPRFIVKNKLQEGLSIREPGSNRVLMLSPGELLPLRFLRQGTAPQLCLCYPGLNNPWSSPFNISNVGSVHVKISRVRERQKLIRIDIILEQATIFLHISEETKHWPFSMRNESDIEILFFQSNPNVDEDEEDRGSGWRPIKYRLPPRSIMPYAWDYPAAKNKDLGLIALGKERFIKLAAIGANPPWRLPVHTGSTRQRILDISVIADGPTQTLILSNWKASKSLYKQKSRSATASSATGFEVKDQDTDVTLKVQLRFAGIGISLINRQLRELVYVTFRDIELRYSESALHQVVSTTVKWIQVDNQLYGGIFPIILYPSVVPKTGKEMDAHPIFHAAVTRVKDDSYGVLYIKYFTVLLQQMTIEIDEDFIFAMLDFTKIPGASWSEVKEGKLCDEELDIPEPKQEQQGQDVYFEVLHLQPMQFDLSFVRTERINAEDTMASSNPLMLAVNILTMSIGNVNDAPIRYNALLLENARVSVNALMSNIQTHYMQESMRQIHIVLGSADILGNPVGLFNNVTSGIGDIFYEPYQGFVMSGERPQELGIGIAKGASSFVKKSVFGFSDSMAKFTGSISKGLATATLDKEFQDRRRMSRARNRPKHALYGITSGGNAFAESMISGITGLGKHPIEGAKKEGVAGLMKGFGKGVLGAVTKPAIGAFDLASSMAEGVRNTTTVFDQDGLDRMRLTRYIGRDGIVRPYDERESLGQFWLKTLDTGKYFNEDYIAHLQIQDQDKLVLLTYNCIIQARMKNLRTERVTKLDEIQTISKERTGMNITLKGGTTGPFIPVHDEESRNWWYNQVAIAVNAYNDERRATG